MGIVTDTRTTSDPLKATSVAAPATPKPPDNQLAGAQALNAAQTRSAAIAPLTSQVAAPKSAVAPATAVKPGSAIAAPTMNSYEAAQRTIDNATDTVEGRVGGIISKDSELMQM